MRFNRPIAYIIHVIPTPLTLGRPGSARRSINDGMPQGAEQRPMRQTTGESFDVDAYRTIHDSAVTTA